jgi:hypothetical protein
LAAGLPGRAAGAARGDMEEEGRKGKKVSVRGRVPSGESGGGRSLGGSGAGEGPAGLGGGGRRARARGGWGAQGELRDNGQVG